MGCRRALWVEPRHGWYGVLVLGLGCGSFSLPECKFDQEAWGECSDRVISALDECGATCREESDDCYRDAPDGGGILDCTAEALRCGHGCSRGAYVAFDTCDSEFGAPNQAESSALWECAIAADDADLACVLACVDALRPCYEPCGDEDDDLCLDPCSEDLGVCVDECSDAFAAESDACIAVFSAATGG